MKRFLAQTIYWIGIILYSTMIVGIGMSFGYEIIQIGHQPGLGRDIAKAILFIFYGGLVVWLWIWADDNRKG